MEALKLHLKDQDKFIITKQTHPLFQGLNCCFAFKINSIELRKKAANAYAKLVTLNEFTLAELKAMNDEALFKEDHFFGQKIPGSLISPNPLTNRLQDANDNSILPFPCVISPVRKLLLQKLLPLPQKSTTLIEGFSQAGKSNFGIHLVLMYRAQKKNKSVVMYIGNLSAFKRNPHEYVLQELFYWFHEEIEEDLMIQNMVLEYICNPTTKTRVLTKLIQKLVRLANSKGKLIVLLFDTFNRKNNSGADQTIFEKLMSLADKKILITTNTDTKISDFNRGDVEVLDLNELYYPIEFCQLSKIVLKLFPNSKNGFQKELISAMGNNLNLIFLFYNYCATNNFLNLNNADEILHKCGDFSREYVSENKNKHVSWRKAARKKSKQTKFISQLEELMLLINSNNSVKGYPNELIDHIYLYLRDGCIFAINPLIQKMFQIIYWSPDSIGKFLNTHGSEISGYAFGNLFEYYMIQKMQEMSMEKRPLVLQLGEGQILKLEFEIIKKVGYGQSYDGITEKESASIYDLIAYDRHTSNKNVCFETPQQNFPFFDLQITLFDNSNEKTSHNMINFKIHGRVIEKDNRFREEFLRFAHNYGLQAKKQLSIFFNMILICLSLFFR